MTEERLLEIQHLVQRLQWLVNDKKGPEPVPYVTGWEPEPSLLEWACDTCGKTGQLGEKCSRCNTGDKYL